MSTPGPDPPADRPNGVLSISGSQQERGSRSSRSSRNKTPQEGVVVKIRYLPPGMKYYECVRILGDEWKIGNGKVDWMDYDGGKEGRLGKPCRPGVCYLRLTKSEYMPILSEFVRNSGWEDCAETYNDPSLPSRPFVEINPLQRVPPAKGRADPRMGTIDTDPDFMKFLEELANPSQPGGEEEAAEEKEDPKNDPLITPLIEYLRAKKANKEKEAAQAKTAKQKESKAAKTKVPEEPKKTKEKEKSKGEKLEKGKENVKILTKKAATDAAAEAAKNVAKQIAAPAAAASASASSSAAASSSADGSKNRRAGIAAAAKILQRDLGLSPGTAHRRARLDAAKGDTDARPGSGQESQATAPDNTTVSKTAEAPESQPSTPVTATAAATSKPASSAPAKSSTKSRGRGAKNAEKGKAVESGASTPGPTAANPPVILKKKATPAAAAQTSASPSVPSQPANAPGPKVAAEPAKSTEKPKAASGSTSQKKTPTIAPGATRGFVKHANPSQGVTEALLKESLGMFGTVTFVEIDKRKGFAYVDFSEHEALVKAVAASPVAVAQANVLVLERRDKKPAQAAAPAPAAASSPAVPSEKGSGSSRRRRGKGGDKGDKGAGGPGQATAAPSGTGSGSGSKSAG